MKKKDTKQKKDKYISLKEAAKLSGYSSDYIGYLIRTKKIKGKSVSLGKTWMITPETLLNYKIRGKKEKKIAKDLKIKRFFLSKKISRYFPVFKHNLSEGLRYALPSVLLFLIIGISALVIYAFPKEEQKIEIFPTVWSVESNGETSWLNAQNVLSRDLDENADFSNFNLDNSAGLNVEIVPLSETEEELPVDEAPEGAEEIPPSGIDESTDEEIPLNGIEEELPIEEDEIPDPSGTEEVPINEEVPDSSGEEEEPIEEESIEEEELIEELEPEPEPESEPEPEPEAEPQEEQTYLQKFLTNLSLFSLSQAWAQEECEECQEQEEVIEQIEEEIETNEEIEEPEEVVQTEETEAEIILPTVDGEMPADETSEEVEEVPDSSGTDKKTIEETEEQPIIFTNQASIILSGFSLPEDRETFAETKDVKRINVNFSFASQGKKAEDDQILFEWSLDEESWNNLVTFNQNQQYSNNQNSGFFSFSLPNDFNWQEIDNLKIRISYLTNNDLPERLPVYLDSVWLELTYDEKNDDEGKIEKLSSKKDFKGKEEPEFDFHYMKKKKNVLSSAIESLEEAINTYDFWENVNLTIEIKDFYNETSPQIETEIIKKDNGDFSVKLKKTESFKPGLYTIVLRIEEDGNILEAEQSFVWGILAINTNKSVYLPDEQVYLQMAALADNGDTICDADLLLEITAPDSTVSHPDIQLSGFCGPNNITNVPDYFAYYQVQETGSYQMHLINLDNGYEITDSFEVWQKVPFEVERIGPTRIYPPADYEMTIKVKVIQDFNGQIIEQVPACFEIIEPLIKNNPNAAISGDWSSFPEDKTAFFKEIIYENDWQKGETYELTYQFHAPFRSPQIYFIGPLQFVSESLVFSEARQWQIAADAAIEMEDYGLPSSTTSSPFTLTGDYTITITDANILIVQVHIYGTATVSSIAWDPTGVNEALALARADGDSNGRTEIWYKALPTAGTKDITITYSAAPTVSMAAAIGLKNVHYPQPVNPNCATGTGCNGGTGSGSSSSTSITTQYNNSWIISVSGITYNDGIASYGSDQVEIWNLTNINPKETAAGSYEAKASAGSDTQTFNWDTTKSRNWAITAVEFRELITDVSVTASGTQTSSVLQGTTDFYVGGKFAITHNTGSSTVTGIKIQEQGTVDAQNELSNIELYYDLDTSDPYDCASEDYAGGATQFGTSTSFDGADGKATFTDTGVVINQTQTMCVYVVLDVDADADGGDTIDIQITNPGAGDITLGDSDVLDTATAAISGSTIIQKAITKYTQRAYIWENDNGIEIGGVDDNTQQAAGNTAITSVRKGERVTLRTHIDVDENGSTRDLGLFYDRNDGIFTKVQDSVAAITGSGSGCGSGASANYTCSTAYNGGSSGDGFYTSLAFDFSGNPWISFTDTTNYDIIVAKYVGTGGSGCGSGVTAWQCSIAYDGTNAGYTSIAFDPAGNPWVSFQGGDGHDAVVAKYVGSGGSGCGTGASAAWSCSKAYDGSSIEGYPHTFIAFDPSGKAWVSFNINEAGMAGTAKVAEYVGTGGSGCGTGVTEWSCSTIYEGDFVGDGTYTSIAFDPSGNAWVSFADATYYDTIVAKYVGSGGSGCGAGASSAWSCSIAYDGDSSGDGEYTSIAFDPSGNAWVSLTDNGSYDTIVAKYVGSGGSGCGAGASSAWSCSIAYDGDSSGDGEYTSIAFDPSGNAWVSLRDAGDYDVKIARIYRGGELLTTSGLAGENGAAISESHADMTTVSDTDNRDDADCADGTSTWVNGKWFESEQGQNILSSVGDGKCTEVAFTIDASQAVAGQTYRFIVSLQDSWRKDKGPWRGPESIVQYATLTIEDPTEERSSKDNSALFGSCGSGASSDFSCSTAFNGGDADDGRYTSIAFDASGNAWVSLHDHGTGDGHAVVARYVGSGGSGCGTGITAWSCSIAYDGDNSYDGQYTSIAFDPSGNAWVSLQSEGSYDTIVAQYVGSGGSGCGAGASSEWSCSIAYDGDISGDGTHSSIAFDPSGNAWVGLHDAGSYDTIVARYVGSGGSGCGSGASSAWDCSIAYDGDSSLYGGYTSIAFDPSGNAWVSLQDYNGYDTIVAKYVGSGGSGCGSGASSAWNCSIAYDGDSSGDGRHTSIAFDPSGNAWVSLTDNGSYDTIVAKYVGSGGSGCGSGASSAWNCSIAYDGNSSLDSWFTSIAFDPSGNAWVSLYDYNVGSTVVAKLNSPHYKNDLRYLSDLDGQTDIASDDSTRDPITVQKDERPFFMITQRKSNNYDMPYISWNGQSTTAPSSKAISLEIYRLGTTNAWETVTLSTDTCSSTGANTDCDVAGSGSGPPSEYYETDGSYYWVYVRVIQEKDGTSSETLKTDSFTITASDLSSSSSTTAYSFQRKTWYDGTRYWKAFNNGSAIRFWYSADQTNWYSNSNATIEVATNDFSIEADSSYAFIAYTDGYDVKTRAATSYPNINFSWSAATTPYDGNPLEIQYFYPTISKDTNNKLRVNVTTEEEESPTLNETACNGFSGWYWYTTNGRSACWSKTLADSVSWNKGVGDDTDNPGTFTCAAGYTLGQRMEAASAGEWYKIVSEVNSVTITSSHNGQAGASYISALAIADCVDGTRDLCTGDGCTGATDWSTCCSYYRTWAGASGKSALPYLSTDAGTTQATNDYWDACVQSGTEDQTLGCSSGNNYFYLNRKACDDGDSNYSWAAACGSSSGNNWDTLARLLGTSSCNNQYNSNTSITTNFVSFRVVVRP